MSESVRESGSVCENYLILLHATLLQVVKYFTEISYRIYVNMPHSQHYSLQGQQTNQPQIAQLFAILLNLQSVC